MSKSTVVGNLEIIKNFKMSELNDRLRTIRVWTPSNYNKNKKYPVIYMHDGQNLFDDLTSYAGEWVIDETIEQLIRLKKVEGFIVVGIDNGEMLRMSEYTPNLEDSPLAEGSKYADFIVNTLKPYIDKNYNTLSNRENTFIMGSSMGGLISFYTGLKYHNIFGYIGAFSTSFQINTKEARDNFIRSIKTDKLPKLYLDSGSLEHGYTYLNEVANTLREIGYNEDNTKIHVEYGHAHNEDAWRARFPGALLWLLK